MYTTRLIIQHDYHTKASYIIPFYDIDTDRPKDVSQTIQFAGHTTTSHYLTDSFFSWCRKSLEVIMRLGKFTGIVFQGKPITIL